MFVCNKAGSFVLDKDAGHTTESFVMLPRSRDFALPDTIDEEFTKIYASVSFNLFRRKVCDYDSSTAEASFLSPDQEAINKYFARTEGLLKPEVCKLLETYFHSTLRASEVYRTLLKGIEIARRNQTSIDQALHLVHIGQQEGSNPNDTLHQSILEELRAFAAMENPFSQQTLDQFQLVQEGYEQMGREMAESRKRLYVKVRNARMRNRVLPYVLVATGGPILLCLALPAAIAGLVVSAFSDEMMVQLKSWWSALKGRFSNDLLYAQCAQLDAVSKGNYIITQELMTVKCQGMRLRNDVESTKRRILFFEKRMQDFGSLCVVVKQLRLNTASSDQQMKDFSEQVVLCCRTLERARKLVYEKITGHRWESSAQVVDEDSPSSGDDPGV